MFSTLHTNDAAGAFTRLVDMGVEPYLVASTVEGVMAQRLIRILCTKCREEYIPNPDELPPDLQQWNPQRLWCSQGCRNCRETGYTGRTGVDQLTRERSPYPASLRRASEPQV